MGFVMRDLTRRWPAARIPFEIDPALPPDQKQIVLDAVFFWNNTAGVILTPHAGEPDFLLYVADAAGQFGGHSDIGRAGGQQIIRMDFGWSEAVGALLHETGHAAGLIHEHQRPDRDQYVIAPANLNADTVIDTTDVPIGPYDCRSVMHYYTSATDPNAFRTKAPGCWYPHHGITLSPGDVRALQSLYWGAAWVDRQTRGHDIGVGADGSAWLVGISQSGHAAPASGGFPISRWDGSTWHQLPGAAVRISAASAQAAWCIDATGAIFEWNDARHAWDKQPGVAIDIAMATDGSVWMIGGNAPLTQQHIFRWAGRTWVPVAPLGFPTNFHPARIAAASSHEAWVVTANGQILHWRNQAVSSSSLPGTAHDIGVGADGTVGITSRPGGVLFWSSERSQWVEIDSPPLLPGTSPRLIEIAIAPNGLPWVVNPDLKVFERTLAPWL